MERRVSFKLSGVPLEVTSGVARRLGTDINRLAREALLAAVEQIVQVESTTVTTENSKGITDGNTTTPSDIEGSAGESNLSEQPDSTGAVLANS